MTFSKIKNTGFYKKYEKNRFVLLSFVTAIAIWILIAFCYDMAPFGDITILRMDLYHQYGPLFAELRDRLVSGGSLLYSWQSGGGGSFLGNFFNYLSSPLSLLVLFFKHINITDAIALIIILKCALSAASFTYYLKASDEFKKHNPITAGFGLLYAFSGYFIAYYWNVMWLDGMLLLPLIVLGIERIVNDKSPKLYVITLALLIISSYYMGFMACIFAVLYALTYYFGKYGFEKRLIRAGGNFICFSILAAGISAVCLYPTLHALKACSATSGTFPSDASTYFNIFDFLANHMASLEPTIRSSGEDVLPNIYCGIATVMLAILYLYIKSIPIKEKISRALLLVFLFLSFDINVLNYIWHGFHFPNDLPYRFSFMYSFVLLTVAFKALIRIRELKGKDLLNIGLGTCVFIVLLEELGSKNVNTATIIVSLVFAVLYTIVLSLLNNKKFLASSVACLLFCCMFAEIAIANTDHYDIDQPKTNYASDYTDFREIKNKLDEREGNDFYRMELTDLRTRMDPSWYGYNGVSAFSSMAYEKTANLQYNLGMFGNYINSYTYNPQTPVYNAMFGIKYLVNNSEKIKLNDKIYTQVTSNEKFTAYENKYSLPIAFCVSNNIENWNSSFNNPFETQADFIEKATGVSGVFDTLVPTEINYSNLNEFGDDEIMTGNYMFSKTSVGESSSFTLTFTPEKDQNVYVYVKSDDVDTITVRDLDGNLQIDQDVDEEYILDIGECKANKPIFIDIPVAETASGYVDAFVVGLNTEKFEEAYKIMKSGSINMTEFSDTGFKGTVDAAEDCILYTSVNFDDSWEIMVDGKALTYDDVIQIGDALFGIKLTAGEHKIIFDYQPKGLKQGAIISVISVTLMIVLLFIPDEKKIRLPSGKKSKDEAPKEALPAENKRTDSAAENKHTT
ncbi:MAG: YfhO family protein [Clostridia bacterium]|nr:YfhO family protein [Clostridia bacterium]